MSEENVDHYGRVLDAWNRGAVDELVEGMAHTVEIRTALTGVEGSYLGHDGARRWWQDYHDVFPDWHAELVRVRAIGNATLAELRLIGHGGESGAPVDQQIWHVVHWQDGLAVRISRHDSETEALEAVGLSE